MMPRFNRDEEAFRAEVVAFIDANRGVDGFHFQGSRWPRVKELYRQVGARGWLAAGWPEEHGGLGSPALEYILWDEMAYARAARPPLGAGIVAKTIIAHADDEQRARWLPQIRAGEIFFSLGYSEPEAGSDLAGLRTRAERRGHRYLVSGEKCWTSYAQDSDYLWALCRTGPPSSRAEGLSLFIVDLQAHGVTVRPLPTIDGERLNHLYLEEVEVPLENRIGPENGGWRLVKEALAVERHVQFPPKRLRRDLEDLVAWIKASGLDGDAVVRNRVSDLAARVMEVEMLGLLALESAVRGPGGGVEAAFNKLAGCEVCQEIARAALDLGGPSALVTGSTIEFLWRQSTWETIGGGTSEIMRGVIAREGLGLGAVKHGG
jgi:alkylation response protein AidB-like acyl-CoA dehydrogenase